MSLTIKENMSQEKLLNVGCSPADLKISIKYNREFDKYVKLMFGYGEGKYQCKMILEMTPEVTTDLALRMIKLNPKDYPDGFGPNKDAISSTIQRASNGIDGSYETLVISIQDLRIYMLYNLQSALVDGQIVYNTYCSRDGFKLVLRNEQWGTDSEIAISSGDNVVYMLKNLGHVLLREIF